MKVQYLKAVRSITASAKQAQCQEEPGLVRHDFSVNMDQNLRESMRKVFDSAWDMISAHTDSLPPWLNVAIRTVEVVAATTTLIDAFRKNIKPEKIVLLALSDIQDLKDLLSKLGLSEELPVGYNVILIFHDEMIAIEQ